MSFNPEQRCISCNRFWNAADEACPQCGFDPVNDEDDAKAYEEAVELYKQMKDWQE